MKQKELFAKFWKVIEDERPLTVEIIGRISKVLWKENGRYYLSTGNEKGPVSRRRARTIIHDMVARILDEQRVKGKR